MDASWFSVIFKSTGLWECRPALIKLTELYSDSTNPNLASMSPTQSPYMFTAWTCSMFGDWSETAAMKGDWLENQSVRIEYVIDAVSRLSDLFTLSIIQERRMSKHVRFAVISLEVYGDEIDVASVFRRKNCEELKRVSLGYENESVSNFKARSTSWMVINRRHYQGIDGPDYPDTDLNAMCGSTWSVTTSERSHGEVTWLCKIYGPLRIDVASFGVTNVNRFTLGWHNYSAHLKSRRMTWWSTLRLDAKSEVYYLFCFSSMTHVHIFWIIFGVVCNKWMNDWFTVWRNPPTVADS